MGSCCSLCSEESTQEGYTETTSLNRRQPKGTTNQSHINQPTAEEKRKAVAEAAEKRKKNWRQGGNGDEQRSERLQQRREKEDLIGRIEALYAAKGETVPFGLPSCDLETLRKHYSRLS